MLKIKDSVDLKDLGKFGYSQCGKPAFQGYFKKVNNEKFLCIESASFDPKNNSYKICEYRGTLYSGLKMFLHCGEAEQIPLNEKDVKDLIQAGLVEKVE